MKREIRWIKAALKVFRSFPEGARRRIVQELMIAAADDYPPLAKPLKGGGWGRYGADEIALRYNKSAYRVFYTIPTGGDLHVFHAFQKKSPRGIETPKIEIKTAKERLQRLLKEIDE